MDELEQKRLENKRRTSTTYDDGRLDVPAFLKRDLTPLQQLRAYAIWEKRHNQDLNGKKHIAQWAVEEIERLQARADAAEALLNRVLDGPTPFDEIQKFTITTPNAEAQAGPRSGPRLQRPVGPRGTEES